MSHPKFSVAFEIAGRDKDRTEAFALYQQAFGARKVSAFSPSGPDAENLHIIMKISSFEILLHPCKEKRPAGAVNCQLHFDHEHEVRTAYNALIQGGRDYSIGSYPHAPVSALVTDKYGVSWWLHT